jgi:Flp pilus assembly protein TadG
MSGHERGSTALEVVVIVPVMMLVILLAVQAAMWAVAAEVVQAAAAVGSQTAAAQGSSPAAGTAAAQAYLFEHGGTLISKPSVQVESSAGQVEVRVSAQAVEIVPLFDLGVSAVRVEPLQEFRESG